MNKKSTNRIPEETCFRIDFFRMSTAGVILLLGILSTRAISVQKSTGFLTVDGALNDYISKRLINCNGDFYSTHVDAWGETYFHLKNIHWASQAQSLSQADRLNGMEWKGIVQITAAVYRRTLEIHRKQWGGWSDNFQDTGSAVKQNGKWQISFSGSTFYFSPEARRQCSFYAALKSAQ